MLDGTRIHALSARGDRVPLDRRYVLLIAAFAVLRAAAASRHPTVFDDTPSYLDLNFIGGALRLWTVPLVYNLLPADAIREAFQIMLGIACWSALGVSVARSVKDQRVGFIAFALVLLLGLVPQVTEWDADMLSESIVTSLLVLLVALAMRPRTERKWLAAAFAILTLWAFARADDMIVFLVFAPLLLAFAARRLPRPTALASVVAILALAGWGGYSALIATGDQPIRTFNAAELAIDRWVDHPSTMRYLAAHGLPVELVTRAARKPFPAAETWLYDQPRFRDWVDESFTSAYAGLIVRGFPESVTRPLSELPTAATSPIYGYEQSREVLPLSWLWDTAGSLTIAIVALLTAVAIGARMRVPWLALGLTAAACLFCFQAVDLATTDAVRLLEPADVLLHVGLLIAAASVADWLASARPRRGNLLRGGASPTQHSPERESTHAVGRQRRSSPDFDPVAPAVSGSGHTSDRRQR